MVDPSYYFYRRAASNIHLTKVLPAIERSKKRTTLTELSKAVNMSYLSITYITEDMAKERLLDRYKIGKEYAYELTDKGRALCELCRGVVLVIEKWDDKDTIDKLNKLEFKYEKNR